MREAFRRAAGRGRGSVVIVDLQVAVPCTELPGLQQHLSTQRAGVTLATLIGRSEDVVQAHQVVFDGELATAQGVAAAVQLPG